MQAIKCVMIVLFVCFFHLSAWADTPGTLLTASSVTQETTLRIMDRVNLSGGSSSPKNAQNFTALTYADLNAFPPYTMGAVGPTQYIACCNGMICSYDRTTGAPDEVLDTLLENFFNSVLVPPFLTSNPRIRYDNGTSRWYIVVNNFNPNSDDLNLILVAASNTPTITSSTEWTFFTFTPGQEAINPDPSVYFADFPTLGVDNIWLVIGVNALDVSNSTYMTSDGFVITKESIIANAPEVYAFRDLISLRTGTGLQTPQGVDVFDTRSTTGYLIGVDHTKDITPSATQTLQLRTIEMVSSVPNISENIPITISTTALPINIPHKFNSIGTPGYLLPSDDRLCISHVRNEMLYTAQCVGVDNKGTSTGKITRNGVRWYQIDLSTIARGSAHVNESSTFFASTDKNDAGQRSYFNPSIITNAQNTILVSYCTAGTNEFINAGYGIQYQNDRSPMLTQGLFTSSSTAYNPSQEPLKVGGRRWGDYANASADPSDSSLWAIQEFCNATNSYGCQVTRNTFLAPPTITSVSPSSINTGTDSIKFTINAASAEGQGFFDPTSPPSSLTVSIVDVDVLSIRSVTETEIQLIISTSTSDKGTRTITVTNPDGQTTQGVEMLTVF